jgi:cell division protein FtsW
MPLFSLRMPKGYSKSIHATVLLLSVFGAIMSTSAGMNQNATTNTILFSLIKQILFIIVGYVLMVNSARYGKLRVIQNTIFYVALATTILLLLPLGFEARGGAQAWIVLPFINITIQPSEFAKVVIILLFASYLGDVQAKTKTVFQIIKIPMGFLLVYTFIIIVLQSDLGSGFILFVLGWFLLLIPSIPKLKGLKIGLSMITILGFTLIFWLLSPAGLEFIGNLPISSYQISRFTDMANPFIERHDSAFQLFNSLIAFTKGNWWGIGLGKSVQKLGYLPVADSDYILPIIVEEIGIFGFVAVLVGYATILFTLLSKVMKVVNEKGKMIVFGVALLLMLHFILNVGGVTASIPLTGVPLLMISAGGSSLLAIMIAIGFAQGIIARESKGTSE